MAIYFPYVAGNLKANDSLAKERKKFHRSLVTVVIKKLQIKTESSFKVAAFLRNFK